MIEHGGRGHKPPESSPSFIATPTEAERIMGNRIARVTEASKKTFWPWQRHRRIKLKLARIEERNHEFGWVYEGKGRTRAVPRDQLETAQRRVLDRYGIIWHEAEGVGGRTLPSGNTSEITEYPSYKFKRLTFQKIEVHFPTAGESLVSTIWRVTNKPTP